MSHQLSSGSIKLLQTASPDDVSVFETQHTLQFLSIKRVGNTPGATSADRYRIIMSDGIHYMQAMLATQLNTLVQDNTIGKNTIAVIDNLTCNYVQEKRYVLRRFVSSSKANFRTGSLSSWV